MDEKYKKYYGIMLFAGVVLVTLLISVYFVFMPKSTEIQDLNSNLESSNLKLEKLKKDIEVINAKKARLKNNLNKAQKRVYAPEESDLGNDTLFFTVYKDLLEMLNLNSIRVKNIEYTYNPENDSFVKNGAGNYFVCQVDMDLISNYENLGKFLESIYSYPYYIKMDNVEVTPYEKDKTILMSKISLNLYSKTAPYSEL